jgi:hypothetical protein
MSASSPIAFTAGSEQSYRRFTAIVTVRLPAGKGTIMASAHAVTADLHQPPGKEAREPCRAGTSCQCGRLGVDY